MKRFFVILGVCSIFFSACSLKPISFEGTSMMPTINDGDKIFIDKSLGELKRGEIISFLYPKDQSKWYMKRIIGLPNETVEIREGKVFVNDQLLDEPYVDENFNQKKQSFTPKKVPENAYFVIGDNRDNSSDSRFWGAVNKELITGKYTATYFAAKK